MDDNGARAGRVAGGSRPATVRKLGETLEIDPHELLVEDDG